MVFSIFAKNKKIMDFKLSFTVNETIFLRNPEHSELGKKNSKTKHRLNL